MKLFYMERVKRFFSRFFCCHQWHDYPGVRIIIKICQKCNKITYKPYETEI